MENPMKNSHFNYNSLLKLKINYIEQDFKIIAETIMQN